MNTQRHNLGREKVLTEDQAKVLFKELRRENDSSLITGKNLKFVMDFYIFHLAYFLGLRISELADLRWADIGSDYVLIRHGKGDKKRSVTFGEKTCQLFEAYRKFQIEVLKRQCTGDDFIFIGKRGKISRHGIHRRCQYWFDRTGMPKTLSFHSLRHGAATRWLDGGVSLSLVRDLLGHSNISITSAYLHLTKAATERLKAIS